MSDPKTILPDGAIKEFVSTVKGIAQKKSKTGSEYPEIECENNWKCRMFSSTDYHDKDLQLGDTVWFKMEKKGGFWNVIAWQKREPEIGTIPHSPVANTGTMTNAPIATVITNDKPGNVYEEMAAKRKAEHDEYIKITQQMIVQLAAVKEELSLLRSSLSVLLVNLIPPKIEEAK